MDDVSLKVFVGSVDFNATEDDVEEAFKPYGEIVHVVLLRDKETQKSRGFGFVTFKERHSVEAAIQGMNKKPILGRPIVVNYAEKKAGNSSSGNSGTVANQNNYNPQQNQAYGYGQQANPYYQGYNGQQQAYGQWNQQGYGAWGQQAYWGQQQAYNNWGQQAQAWSQQMQQQGNNQGYSGYQQTPGYNNGMTYGNNNSGGGGF